MSKIHDPNELRWGKPVLVPVFAFPVVAAQEIHADNADNSPDRFEPHPHPCARAPTNVRMGFELQAVFLQLHNFLSDPEDPHTAPRLKPDESGQLPGGRARRNHATFECLSSSCGLEFKRLHHPTGAGRSQAQRGNRGCEMLLACCPTPCIHHIPEAEWMFRIETSKNPRFGGSRLSILDRSPAQITAARGGQLSRFSRWSIRGFYCDFPFALPPEQHH